MMEDPKPLAEEGDAFERALLESARIDVGSAGAESSCLRAFEGARVTGSAFPRPPLHKLLLVAVPGIVIFGALGVWWLHSLPEARRVEHEMEASEQLVARESPPSAPPSTLAPVVAASDAGGEPTNALSEADAGHQQKRRTRALNLPRTGGSTLAEEVALLRSARVALASDDPAAALNVLDRYAHEFEAGILQLEAEVLYIQALLTRGDMDAARARAERFLSAHADGPHAKRVRNLLVATTNR